MLLHAERVLVLLAAAVAVITVVTRAVQGPLPIELSTTGVRYKPRATEAAAAAVVDSLARDMDDLAGHVAGLQCDLDRLARLAHPQDEHEQ